MVRRERGAVRGRGTVTSRWWARACSLTVASLMVLLGTLSCGADAGSAVPTSNDGAPDTVADCLERGEVWLLLVTENGERLRSECVGTPQNGSQALAAAQVSTVRSKGGYLCTLAGYPESCPRTFDGQYWQYSQARGLAEEWVYSQKGADSSRVRAGSIEGWCRNAPGEKYCTLPTVRGDETAAARVDHQAGGGGSVWLGLVAVVVLAGAGLIVWLRRREQFAD